VALQETLVYEEGDKLYLVAPVTPFDATSEEVAGFTFGADILKRANNPHIAWFRGHYVEADKANGNGAMWTSKELAIKGLTPMLMPVTVMHDPRTAVGTIADLSLLTPDKDKVARAKIDTVLALWAHRFPEVVEEANHNYAHGSLMQSMECFAPNYDCAVCGMGFTKLPQGAEREHWCAHLRGESDVPGVRILRSVVFTGTGLIFGSRGATGADPLAQLETFQQEVAEFHQRVHRDTPTRRRKRRMETVEIAKTEYDELRARPDRSELEKAEDARVKAEKDLEAAETAQKAAETERDELKVKVQGFEEQGRRVTLRDERIAKLGNGFTAKLGEKTKQRLQAQAGELKDDDWTARLEELEELTGAKRDDGGTTSENADKDDTFTPEEIARHQGGGGGSPSDPTPNQRRSVLAGLSSTRR
jgi:hypothetical protein